MVFFLFGGGAQLERIQRTLLGCIPNAKNNRYGILYGMIIIKIKHAKTLFYYARIIVYFTLFCATSFSLFVLFGNLCSRCHQLDEIFMADEFVEIRIYGLSVRCHWKLKFNKVSTSGPHIMYIHSIRFESNTHKVSSTWILKLFNWHWLINGFSHNFVQIRQRI